MPATKPQPKPRVKATTPNAPEPAAYIGPPLLGPYPRFAGLNPAQYAKLQDLCGPRWIDLLFHLPSRLLDRSATPPLANAPVGERITTLATVIKRPAIFKSLGNRKRPFVVELQDAQGTPLKAVYFNPGAWLERAFPYEKGTGGQVIVSGKLEQDAKGLKMIHPDVWNAGRGLEDVAKVWPLYPLTAGLPQGWVTRAVQTALAFAAENPPPEWLPDSLVKTHKLPTFTEALRTAHTPQTEADLIPTNPARVRLALDEFLATQLALQHARVTSRMAPGIAHGSSSMLRRRLLESLPFQPTADQSTALAEIDTDLSAPRPMLRLLQGDVGTGKTLVALMALLRVIENGQQGVLMAPTEILAQQLYANAKRWLEPLGVTIGLLTGSQTAAQKKKLKQHVREGFVNLLVGTHALAEDDVIFDKLGLAVIDEQHRFGVRQRMALSANQKLQPDMLIMTATPIPRTLALTAYGDMDVSSLRTRPPGRTPIQTLAMQDARVDEVVAALPRLFAKGEQVYWVCPLVDENIESDLTAATVRYAYLTNKLDHRLTNDDSRKPITTTPQAPATSQVSSIDKSQIANRPPLVALLHGQMKASEKDAAMDAFKSGVSKLLVSTTVIEVGVDVPNASLMVVEHAERFGLSQLHQLRGRVGRGTAASRCILLYSNPLTAYAKARIEALRNSDDGFFLAEKDLELRGPGEILGTRQAGQLATRLADLHHHRDLLPLARDAAQSLLGAPLPAQQRAALSLLLNFFQKHAAAEYLRGG